jgi:hypothetical protein
MKELGCTTPFGLGSNKNYTICTELETMKKAMQLFKNMMESRVKTCPYPCKFLQVLVTPSKGLSMYLLNNFNHQINLSLFMVRVLRILKGFKRDFKRIVTIRLEVVNV